MKICHITSVHRVDDVRINLKECVSLSKNYEITLLSNDTRQSHAVNSEFEIINLNKKYKNRLHRIFTSNKDLYKAAIEIDADLYHLHDPELLQIALKFKKQGKIVIFDSHEDTPKQILGKYYIPKVLRVPMAMFFKYYEKYITKNLDAIVCATPTIKQKFEKINKNSVDVNNFPILDEFINIPNDYASKKNQVVYIGGLTEERGLYKMIEVANKLKDVNFIFCGDFASESEKKIALSMTENNNVHYLGYLSRLEIKKILEESKLGLVMLKKNKRYMESLPIKMFEYMAAGIPVIASDFPLWKEILDRSESGECVNPDNVSDITEIIQNILKDEHRMYSMGTNGRESVINNFNWNNEEAKLFKLYKKMEENI